MAFHIETMCREQWRLVAELIHDSTNAWYERRGLPKIFTHGPESTLLFCEVYEALDPGCCLVALESTGNIVGSCFYHPRSTHVSLGIMNVAPQHFGEGIATRLLQEIVGLADAQQVPTRLVSSALNLDSYSLYNRLGFVPHTVYQDMIVHVPADGMRASFAPPRLIDQVRIATIADVPNMVGIEQSHVGIERQKDFELFIENQHEIWRSHVIADRGEALSGFIHSVRHPASNMVGPGFATTEEEIVALMYAALDHHRGQSAVIVVPAQATEVTSALYSWGAKNCELHLGQIRGDSPAIKGISIPTFMPETA